MALTADQLAYWEASPQDFPLSMYIHSPATVFAARVNQASFPNPLMTVTFDTVTIGHYSVIEEGMTILFGSTAGGDDLGRLPVRRDTSGVVSDATTLYIQRASQGVGDGEASLVDNAYITILNQYLVWSVPPYIDDTGVVYKNGNVLFNVNIAQRPQANTGGDVLKIVNEGVTSAIVSFDGSTSAVYNPAASSTLTYAWNFADGTPSTSTSATPGNVSFPLGKRHIRLTVTDSAGSVRIAHALVVVAQRDDPDLIHYWDVESWTERVDGQDLRIRVHQPLSYATYPDGTDVLVCTSEDVDQVGLAGRSHMLFSGWLHDEVNRVEASKQGLVSRLTFQLLDVAGRLKLLHQFPESVDRESGASSWAQMVGLNLDRLAHYSLDWHSTALSRVDYIGANQMDVYAIRGLEIGGDSLFSGVNFIAGAMGYLLTCDINNRLILRQDPQLAPTAAQNSVLGIGFSRSTAETLTLEPKHWQNYEYSFKRMPRVHFNWGETLISSTANMSATSEIPTAFVAAPGLAPGQGTSESNTTRQVSRNVAEIKMRVGNLYRARQNALTENFQFELNPMRHALHPANMEWFEASIASAQSGYRGRLFTAERFLPIEITYRTDVSKRIRRATVAVEREVTNATPATQYTPASLTGNNWSVNLPDISLGDWVYEPIPSDPVPSWSGATPISGWLLSSKGAKAARADSFDLSLGLINYTDISTGLGGVGVDGMSDPYAFARTYALTTTGIYMEPDRSAPSGFSQLRSTANLFGGSNVGHKIRASHMVNGWRGIVAGQNAFLRTVNDFTSVAVSSINGLSLTYTTGDQAADFCICGHDAGHIIALAVDTADSGRAKLYRSTDNGATWSAYAVLYPNVNSYYADVGRQWIEVPYTRADGTPNEDDAGLEIWWYAIGDVNSGQVGRMAVLTAGTATVFAQFWGQGNNGATFNHPMTSFTHDSSYGYLQALNVVQTTADNWDNMTATGVNMGAPASIGYSVSVNGISTNENCFVAWSNSNTSGNGAVQMSFDAGATWFGAKPTTWDSDEAVAVAEFSLYDL